MARSNILPGKTSKQLSGQDKLSPSGKQAARELLVLCTTANISHGRKERISQLLAGTVDWKYLLELAEFQGVAPLIAHDIINNGLSSQVPQTYLERLSQVYNNILYRNLLLSNELINVLSVFNQHGVATIALKGTMLAEQLYGNPALRTVVDIDILVKPEELSQASSLLLEMGYQQLAPQQTKKHPFHEVYSKQAQFPFIIELHWDLDDHRLVAFPLQEIWHRAQTLQIQGGTTMVLSPEDTLLFLSNHLIKQEYQFLRYLSDIAELLKKYDGVLDWDYIIESAHSWGIESAVYYSLRCSRELLGALVPVSAIRELKPKAWRRWLLDFLVSREFFISPTKPSKLRDETYNLVRSLMMKHLYQMALVYIEYRKSAKRGAWLRTVIWIILVFSAALGRNTARFLSGRTWQAGTSQD
jgi:hypothetical protein